MSEAIDDPELILHLGWVEEGQSAFESLQFAARRCARLKGFYPEEHSVDLDNPETRCRMAVHMALVASEVSEALEELRKADFDREKFGEELADVLLRLCDLAEASRISLVDEALLKMEKNLLRPPKHGKVF